ncbi:hypothetical protein QLQ12_46010 [Actinoplanes sp. NEAU-A12]|uniref:Uncharacterized protein n=1 Tax=Actinoplanes sandaracinus TaxID=3045177 RepID=A0ABT6X299_9ACTN|nr:hypothetical protein [Actinoplanes sandaracinus]MDI6105950.1 hypothetical protein [Actinoplanes sandaracinus]
MFREWSPKLVGASGVLTFVSSFLPWWIVQVDTQTFTGSAWQTSSRWVTSVLLTVATATIWLAVRVVRGRVPMAVRLTALAVVAVSMFLTFEQRDDAEPWPPVEARVTMVPEAGLSAEVELSHAEFAKAVMPRNQLRRYTQPGRVSSTGYGYWTGLVGMALTGLTMLTAGRGDRRS